MTNFVHIKTESPSGYELKCESEWDIRDRPRVVVVEDVRIDSKYRFFVTTYDPKNDWYMSPASSIDRATSVSTHPETNPMTRKAAVAKYNRLIESEDD